MARPSSRAFTLIELLVVIAIIGILMALLFPAVGNAIDGARKAQAKNDVTQIANAVLHYESDYGYLPTNSSGKVDKALILILTGDPSATNDNPRRTAYLEVAGAKKGKSGTNSAGDFVDPWAFLGDDGVKDTTYLIKMDNSSTDLTNYDNRLSGIGTNNTNTMKKAAVWNNPSAATSDNGKKNRRYVTSWD